MGRRAAFTLVELIVTVTIIFILIAIILPCINRARDQAKLVKCQTNLHAIGIAMYDYAGSNNGTVVHGSYFTPPPLFSYWTESLYADGDLQVSGALVNENGPTDPMWVTGRGVFYCPSYANPQSSLTTDPMDENCAIFATYGIGYYAGSILWGGGSPNYPVGSPLPLSMYHPMKIQYWRSNHIVAADAIVDMAHKGAITGWNQENVKLRHFNGANYLMGDGHVEWSNQYQLQLIDAPDSIWWHDNGIRGYMGG